MLKKAKKIKIRKPVAKKAGRPIGTPKGKRGYTRRKQKEALRRLQEEQKDDE